ncbi:MAG: serine hydrolase [Thermoanaerobaculia bacterium]
MKRLFMSMLLTILTMTLLAAPDGAGALPDNAGIRRILVDRIDVQIQGVGIVAGVIDESGRRVVAHGTFDDDARTVDGDTIFEIGSATKVFTSLLLADAVERGEVALDDPISKYLPAGVKVPERGGKITLLHLASHTSGLPRLPANLAPKNMENPYADYTVALLYEFLSSYKLPRDVGSLYEYSNLGAGLLGHVLALRAGSDYETLVRERITGRLSMESTTMTLGGALKSKLAPGHDRERKRVPNWDFIALAGAGALRSSTNDMLAFLSAAIFDSPLSAAFASTLKPRHATATPGSEIALGWHISKRPGGEIVWHNGGTGGYRSFIGFDPKRRTGVVVLANMFTESGVDDIGMHLLDSSVPLAAAPKPRKEIAVDAATLAHYVGLYELAPGFILTVTREGNRLFTQATGQPKVEVFAESATEFFLKVTDAQLTFVLDEAGEATSLVLHQGGRDMPAKRTSRDVPSTKERTPVKLDAKLLDRYVGRYELAPNFVVAITREADQLFLQATGQPKVEMFAEREREFFLTVVDAQVTFVAEGEGNASSMILHQNGMDMPGKRID